MSEKYVAVTITADQAEASIKTMQRWVDSLRATIITCPTPNSANVQAALAHYRAEILTLESVIVEMKDRLRFVK